jgi:serine/threonine protein kinase/CheY-like chemotaxis protein
MFESGSFPRGAPGRDGTATVLLVDDEPALLHVIARQLRAAGYTVTECGDGASAAELIGAQPFDVVLSDIDMPGLSGIDLLKLLRERQVEIPVVLMTGNPTIDTAVKAVEHGALRYLTKPVAAAELLETVGLAVKLHSRVTGAASRHGGDARRPSAESATIAPDAVLGGRYRLVRLLGEGGMGQVWEAVQLSTARSVAVKLLHSSVASNLRSAMRMRLLREARVASSVEHPNVVDVFDLFELEDGTPVLVMALLRGKTLWHLLAEVKSLPLADAADLLLAVVSAVGTAHANGIIHRDLKPDNIFLCEEDGRTTVKVLDFGVAKLVSNEPQDGGVLTVTGATVGTPAYMSPEQALGERDVDHRADIWSIGAILYEALSGVRPIQAESAAQMMKQLFTDRIIPLLERVPNVSPTVAKLVDRMLSRERGQRPGDLREVYSELARYARTSAPAFGPPAPSRVASPSVAPSGDEIAFACTEPGSTPAIPERSR